MILDYLYSGTVSLRVAVLWRVRYGEDCSAQLRHLNTILGIMMLGLNGFSKMSNRISTV